MTLIRHVAQKAAILIVLLGVFLLLLTLSPPSRAADDELSIVVFYGRGCLHCSELLDWLKDIKPQYPGLSVTTKEIYFDDENYKLLSRFERQFDFNTDVIPVTIIGEKVFLGASRNVKEKIRASIVRGLDRGTPSPFQLLDQTDGEGKKSPLQKITLPAVITAAALDAVNPCAFAVLVLLLGTIIVGKKRRSVLPTGLAFTAAIYISYFLMGFGLYSAIRTTGIVTKFYLAVAILAIIGGFVGLKDFIWPQIGLSLEVPESWKPRAQRLVQGVSSPPGAFVIGFGVSVILLPCTSGPYIAILGLLSQSGVQWYALGMLLLYNFIFIIPMILITCTIHWGFLTTARVERLRNRGSRYVKLFSGLLMLGLGIVMLLSLQLNWL